ncbi:MAG: FHA domain-containing protein [Ruminococcus sp.]|nr:FHA domain-containing protein [Ruminococcus sp.]
MDNSIIMIAAAALDICALVLMITSYVERRSGRKRWSRMTSDMELVENDRIFPLECDEILIGRHASADIRIQDMSVSRYHAMLNVSGGKWSVTDLNSKSGTYVNGRKVQNIRLYEGDVIALGTRRLVFRRKEVQR